ncbi:hypothetical protein AWC38_SpisGene24707, partial [Stylophora pistillata]
MISSCPFWSSCIGGACGVVLKQGRELQDFVKNSVALATSVTARVRNKCMSALAYRVSSVLFHRGVSHQDLIRLNRLGICMSPDKIMALQRSLGKNFDAKVMSYEKALEEKPAETLALLMEIENLQVPIADNMEVKVSLHLSEESLRSYNHFTPKAFFAVPKMLQADKEKRNCIIISSAILKQVISDHKKFNFPFFKIVGDNIDYELHTRIQTKKHGNQSIHWTHQYAIRDSVIDSLLDNIKPQKSLDELQLVELLPTPDVQARLRRSWAILVSRVVTKHLKEFQFLRRVVINHIPHPFSSEASKMSEILIFFPILGDGHIRVVEFGGPSSLRESKGSQLSQAMPWRESDDAEEEKVPSPQQAAGPSSGTRDKAKTSCLVPGYRDYSGPYLMRHLKKHALVPPATPVKRPVVLLDSSSESTERPPSKGRRQGSLSEAYGVVPPTPSRATKPSMAPAPATEGGHKESDSSYERVGSNTRWGSQPQGSAPRIITQSQQVHKELKELDNMPERQDKLGEELQELIRLLWEASKDDKQAQERLNIHEGIKFKAPQTFTPLNHGKALKTDLVEFYNFLPAVDYCNLRYVHGVATKIVSHAQFLYDSKAENKYPLPESLRARDVAAVSCEVIQDVCKSVDMCRRAKQIERSTAEGLIKVTNVEGD